MNGQFILNWRSMTNDEYKISYEGLSHCPQHKYGKKRWGNKDYFHCVCKDQLHDTIGESCFLFCDVNSDHTCGECVHWLGDVTSKGKRHEKFGSCFYRIGRIGAWWPTCCPQFVKSVTDINSYIMFSSRQERMILLLNVVKHEWPHVNFIDRNMSEI